MTGPSHHKPRRKVKKAGDGEGGGGGVVRGGASTPTSVSPGWKPAPVFPLGAFLWAARSSVTQWEVLPLILMVAGMFRWAAGLWGYSGAFSRSWSIALTHKQEQFRTASPNKPSPR